MINNAPLQHHSLEDFKKILDTISNSPATEEVSKLLNEISCEYTIEQDGLIGISDQKIILYAYKFTGTGKYHTVSFGRDENGFFYHCGSLPNEEKDTVCNFFSRPKTLTVSDQDIKICKHILWTIHQYNDDLTKVLLPEIEADWQRKFGGKEDKIEPVDELGYLKKFAFKANVIIEGDRGSGKTFDVIRFAKEADITPVFLGGHNGIESIDLLGHLVPFSSNENTSSKVSASDLLSGAKPETPYNTQQLIWKDGALTEAFRKASRGEKTILILDELLRIPARELNILLTALSPLDGVYMLRTGRIISVDNGVATEEIIKAPIENLFVAATTNVGGQYAIDDVDPALAERFIILRKDTTERQLKTVLNKLIKDKGFNKNLIMRLLKFHNDMKQAKTQGFVENIPTLRTLSRAVNLADTSQDVWSLIEAQILLWIGRDTEGYPIKEQESAVMTLINKSRNE